MSGSTISTLRDASYRRLQAALSRRDEVNWPLFGLVVLLLGYWLFVRSLERVDGDIVLARYLLQGEDPASSPLRPLLPYLSLLVEFFHWKVLRHFIPLALGWWLAVQATVSLIQVLYDCQDRATARDFLRRHRRRSGKVSEGAFEVSPQTLETLQTESVLLRVGGPVIVRIPNGHAAVTELNGRFVRVIGPGTHTLGHFEYVISVINVAQQSRSESGVRLATKEGIPLTADVGVLFRIDPGRELQSPDRPYPFDPEAVRKAAYAQTVAGGAPAGWERAPLARAKSQLAAVVAQYRLDELLVPEGSGRQPHLVIRQETERKTRAALKEEGIELLRLTISRLAPPEEASRQYVDYWLANWRKRDRIALAGGAAATLQEVETARAEAEVTMLQALVEGLRSGGHDATTDSTDVVLALQLIETLERYAQQSGRRLPGLEPHTESLMSRLVLLQEQLTEQATRADADDDSDGPTPPGRPFVPSRNA